MVQPFSQLIGPYRTQRKPTGGHVGVVYEAHLTGAQERTVLLLPSIPCMLSGL